MPHNRLPRVMKQYFPTGRRNHSRPLKRLLDAWDQKGSTSGPIPWKSDDDDLKKRQSLNWMLFLIWLWMPRALFLKLWYVYDYWYANHCLLVCGLKFKK